MDPSSKIAVVGADSTLIRVMVDSLKRRGWTNTVCENPKEDFYVDRFIKKERPDYVFLVSGRSQNSHAYQMDALESSKGIVKRLLYIASTAVYPENCPIPAIEPYLYTGPVRVREAEAALLQLSGMSACDGYNRRWKTSYISCIAPNIYGLGMGDYTSPVTIILEAIKNAKIRKQEEAVVYLCENDQIDYMFSEDFVEACIVLMYEYPGPGPINIGSGQRISNRLLANFLCKIMDYPGEVVFLNLYGETPATSCLLDCSRLQNIGWMSRVDMLSGLKMTCDDYLKEIPS